MKPQPISLLSTLVLAGVCASLLATPSAAQRLTDSDTGRLVIGDQADAEQDQVALDPNGNRRVNIDGVDVLLKLGKSARRTDIRSYRHALDRTQHNEDYDEKHITIHPDGSTVARRFRRSLGNRRGGPRAPARSVRRRRRGGRRQGGVNIRLGFSRFGQRLRSRFNPKARRARVSAFRNRVLAIVAAVNRGADDATIKSLIRAATGRGPASHQGRPGTGKRNTKRAGAAREKPTRQVRERRRGGNARKVGGGRLIKGLAGKLRGKVSGGRLLKRFGGKLKGKVGRGRLIKGAFNKIRGKTQGRAGQQIGGGRLIKGAFSRIKGKIQGRAGQRIGGGRLIKGAFTKMRGKIQGRVGQKIGGGRLIKGAFNKIRGKIEGRTGQQIGGGRLIKGAFNKVKGRIERKAGRKIGGGRLIKGFASQVGGRIKKKMGKGSKFMGVMKSIGGTIGVGNGRGLLSQGADAAARKIGKGKGGRIVGGLIKGVGGLFGMRLSPYDYEPYDDLYFY